MAWWAWFTACIWVQETVFVDDSGLLESAMVDEGPVCTSDDECSGNFACANGVNSYTDGRGCVERCASDWDCKAGYLCSDDGACR
jgi:hypothetical protein